MLTMRYNAANRNTKLGAVLLFIIALSSCTSNHSDGDTQTHVIQDSLTTGIYSFEALIDTMSSDFTADEFVIVNNRGKGLDGEASEAYGLLVTEKMWSETTRCRTLDLIGTLPDSSSVKVIDAIAGEYIIEFRYRELEALKHDLGLGCIDTTRRPHRRGVKLLRAYLVDLLNQH